MNTDNIDCANFIKHLFGAQKADFTGIKIGFVYSCQKVK